MTHTNIPTDICDFDADTMRYSADMSDLDQGRTRQVFHDLHPNIGVTLVSPVTGALFVYEVVAVQYNLAGDSIMHWELKPTAQTKINHPASSETSLRIYNT
jgi:hypothetical protein